MKTFLTDDFTLATLSSAELQIKVRACSADSFKECQQITTFIDGRRRSTCPTPSPTRSASLTSTPRRTPSGSPSGSTTRSAMRSLPRAISYPTGSKPFTSNLKKRRPSCPPLQFESEDSILNAVIASDADDAHNYCTFDAIALEPQCEWKHPKLAPIPHSSKPDKSFSKNCLLSVSSGRAHTCFPFFCCFAQGHGELNF